MKQRFESETRLNQSSARHSRSAVRAAAVPVAPAVPSRVAGRLMCEGLEGRTLMSVSTNAQGWTVVTPSNDARLIHVSTSGSDTTGDGSRSAPVFTVARARELVRDQSDDQILLRRGDVFFGQPITTWNLSGRSANEPMVIGAYTDPNAPSSARPKLATGIANGIGFTTTTPISNVYIMGVVGSPGTELEFAL